MKTKKILFLFLISLVIASCSVLNFEKRRYTRGYYIALFHKEAAKPNTSTEVVGIENKGHSFVSIKDETDAKRPYLTSEDLEAATTKHLHEQEQIRAAPIGSLPLTPEKISGNPPDDHREEVEKDIEKSRSAIILGFFLPFATLIGVILAFRAKNKMDLYGIKDETLNKQINHLFVLALVGLFVKLLVVILLILAFIAIVNQSYNACYIATMVYKSYDAPEVLVLRKFRDEQLRPYLLGRAFIAVYYSTSPLFVLIFKNNRMVNDLAKGILDKWVNKLDPKAIS